MSDKLIIIALPLLMMGAGCSKMKELPPGYCMVERGNHYRFVTETGHRTVFIDPSYTKWACRLRAWSYYESKLRGEKTWVQVECEGE